MGGDDRERESFESSQQHRPIPIQSRPGQAQQLAHSPPSIDSTGLATLIPKRLLFANHDRGQYVYCMTSQCSHLCLHSAQYSGLLQRTEANHKEEVTHTRTRTRTPADKLFTAGPNENNAKRDGMHTKKQKAFGLKSPQFRSG